MKETLNNEQEIFDDDNRPAWELIHEFIGKFGRIPKNEDELNVLVDYVLDKLSSQLSKEDKFRFDLLNAVCDDFLADCTTYSTMYREMQETKQWLESLKHRIENK